MKAVGSHRLPWARLASETVIAIECPACSSLSAYVGDAAQWHKTRCGLANGENLRRIHIVGGPGSGKTTLAHEIGTRLEIEVHELDRIAFTGPNYAERQLSQRLKDVSVIADRSTWITEGLFILWTDRLLEYADIIIWLDHVSWERSMWRTVQRFVRSALQESRRRQGVAKFIRFHDYARHLQQLVRVFFSSRVYYFSPLSPRTSQIESRQNTAEHLALYREKVIYCYDEEGVNAVLNYIYHCSY